MDGLFLSHVEIALRRSRGRGTGDRSPHTARLAVGFVDLVGFTPLSSELPVAELAALVDEFEDQAFDLVADNDGRIVKFIGDEVMFVMLDVRRRVRRRAPRSSTRSAGDPSSRRAAASPPAICLSAVATTTDRW